MSYLSAPPNLLLTPPSCPFGLGSETIDQHPGVCIHSYICINYGPLHVCIWPCFCRASNATVWTRPDRQCALRRQPPAADLFSLVSTAYSTRSCSLFATPSCLSPLALPLRALLERYSRLQSLLLLRPQIRSIRTDSIKVASPRIPGHLLQFQECRTLGRSSRPLATLIGVCWLLVTSFRLHSPRLSTYNQRSLDSTCAPPPISFRRPTGPVYQRCCSL